MCVETPEIHKKKPSINSRVRFWKAQKAFRFGKHPKNPLLCREGSLSSKAAHSSIHFERQISNSSYDCERKPCTWRRIQTRDLLIIKEVLNHCATVTDF